MLEEVIILGCGPTHVECKYHCEVWGVNGTYNFAKRLDKLFMTDEPDEVATCWYDMVKVKVANPTLVFPIPYPRFQNKGFRVEIYPMDGIREKFKTRFFSNSIAYMLAYALYHTKSIQTPDDPMPRVIEGYEKIYLFGIDMMTSATYIQEKGGVEYWMGVALGMGVKVINTKGSATGKTWNGKMYGYWGLQEQEMIKEKLMAPWELVRVSKSSESQGYDWVKQGDEFVKVKTVTKAGEEVVA